ncbi:hypothetical protein CLF_109682 [Clonorchis sinensis]|uniref:Uncharacterized protein n=1 Tax=Clonorchis sinensis TaxID=79923 RepID=G7YSV5_CLOSI|nr:hypothetical protein CLF_109682 [Clonorchis sinensis]
MCPHFRPDTRCSGFLLMYFSAFCVQVHLIHLCNADLDVGARSRLSPKFSGSDLFLSFSGYRSPERHCSLSSQLSAVSLPMRGGLRADKQDRGLNTSFLVEVVLAVQRFSLSDERRQKCEVPLFQFPRCAVTEISRSRTITDLHFVTGLRDIKHESAHYHLLVFFKNRNNIYRVSNANSTKETLSLTFGCFILPRFNKRVPNYPLTSSTNRVQCAFEFSDDTLRTSAMPGLEDLVGCYPLHLADYFRIRYRTKQTSMDHNKCGRNVRPSNVGRDMQCHTCKAWWHFKYTGLQDDQISQLVNSPDPFVCVGCLYIKGEMHSGTKKRTFKNSTKSTPLAWKDLCVFRFDVCSVFDAKLELLSKALEDAKTRNTGTWMKVDEELSSVNQHLALSISGQVAAKSIQLFDAVIKTATMSLVDRRPLVLIRAQRRNRLRLWIAVSHQPPPNPSTTKGSDAQEEANLTWMQRSKYTEFSTFLSVTDDKGAAVDSTPKSQLLGWTGSDERSQAATPIDTPSTCVDPDVGECCKNTITTEIVKLPIASSTP